MVKFLTFSTFIAQDVLIFFYYIGVLFLPFFIYYYREFLVQKLSFFSTQNQKKFIIFMLLMFLCMELFWRIMFEVMIGYFDMHDYLYEVSKSLK